MANTDTGETRTNMDSSDELQMPVPRIKHDWYQRGNEVIVEILVKTADNVKVDYSETTSGLLAINSNTISLLDQILSHSWAPPCRLLSGSDYSLELDLAHPVVPDQCSHKLTRFKIEIRLRKRDAIVWSTLEDNPTMEKPAVVPIPQVFLSLEEILEASKPALTYPSSSRNPKDWAKVEKEIEKQTAEEKPDGKDAVEALLQQVYGNGSDEVKRAMNKSYQESGGTVLSTNWSEVRKAKVEMKPPSGMEWKPWSL